jgi:hypothetical protein
VLEIPEFASLLQQKTIMEWQLFGPDKKGSYRQVQWEVKGSGENSRITAVKSNGAAFSAEIDFSGRRIIFCQGELGDGEFTEFLQFLLARTYLQVQPGLVHFICESKKERSKASGKDNKTPTF